MCVCVTIGCDVDLVSWQAAGDLGPCDKSFSGAGPRGCQCWSQTPRLKASLLKMLNFLSGLLHTPHFPLSPTIPIIPAPRIGLQPWSPINFVIWGSWTLSEGGMRRTANRIHPSYTQDVQVPAIDLGVIIWSWLANGRKAQDFCFPMCYLVSPSQVTVQVNMVLPVSVQLGS